MKITITLKGEQLMAQATGQSAFPLEPVEKNKFRFENAGINTEFFPEKKEFILKQGGGAYTFSKVP